MKIKRIEHVGVVVRNVDTSKRLWEDCFGIKLGGVEQIPGRPNKLALYPVGESMVELLAGVTPDSKFSKMCDEGKAGIHHICFEVENIDEALDELKEQGHSAAGSDASDRPRRMPHRVPRSGGDGRLSHRACGVARRKARSTRSATRPSAMDEA